MVCLNVRKQCLVSGDLNYKVIMRYTRMGLRTVLAVDITMSRSCYRDGMSLILSWQLINTDAFRTGMK